MTTAHSYDRQLREKLLKEFRGNSKKAKELAGFYQDAKLKLENDVYPHIQGAEPNLTDHGAKHVQNVLENLIALLSDGGDIKSLTGIELYFLGMLALFHDVGNIHGRKNHQQNVDQIFDFVRGTNPSVRREKTLIVRAARAHTGLALNHTTDTLRDLEIDEQLEGKKVRFQQIAAILRFADELAEGPQRTSQLMREQGLFTADSDMFHEYASTTNVLIDRGGQRIVLTYEVPIKQKGDDHERSIELSNFLSFVFDRISKLDQERRYARFYAELLEPFRTIEVRFNFHCGHKVLDTDLQPLKLNDKVIPGEQVFNPADIDPSYNLDHLVKDLIAKCLEDDRHA